MVAELPYGIVERGGVQPRVYRIIDIVDEGAGQYSVKAKLNVAAKHAYVEQNVPVPAVPFSLYDQNVSVPTPTNLNVVHSFEQDSVQGANHVLSFSWRRPTTAVTNIQSFYAEVYTPDGRWLTLYDGSGTTCSLSKATPGRYIFTVKAINTFNRSSDVASETYDFEYGGSEKPLPPVWIGVD